MNRRVAAAFRGRLAYAALVQGAARAVQLGALAAGSALIARHDTADALGTYGLTILVFNVIQTTGDWGLTAIGAQALVTEEEHVSSGTLVWIRAQIQVPFVAIATIICVVAGVTGHRSIVIGFAAGAAAGVLGNIAGSMMAPFQVRLRLDIPAWIDLGSRLAGLIALIVAVQQDAPTLVLAATIPGTALLDLLVTAGVATRFAFSVWQVPPRAAAWILVRRATPLAILTIFSVLYLRANSLVVLAQLGTERLGAYSLAFRIVDVLVIAPSLVLTVVFPVLVRLHRSDVSAYRAAAQRAHDALLGVGCALCLAAALAAHPLIHLLGGDQYLGVTTPLRILAIAGLGGFANALFAQLMIVEGLQTVILKLSGFALAGNLIVSIVLIHYYGLNGAAVAAAISETVGAAIVITTVSRRAKLGLSWRYGGFLTAFAAVIAAVGIAVEQTDVSAIAVTAIGLVAFLAIWAASATRATRRTPPAPPAGT